MRIMRYFLLSCILFLTPPLFLNAAEGEQAGTLPGKEAVAPEVLSAALNSSQVSPESPVHAQLTAEEQAIYPGRSFWVGIELKMAPGWDTYWQNPGDSGFPTQVTWHLPENFHIGPLLWPYPKKFESNSLVAFGYTDTVLLMAEIQPPQDLAVGEKIEIKADVSWVACKESCVPGQAAVSLQLPVTDVMPKLDENSASLFSQTRKTHPQPETHFTIQLQPDQIVLNFKPRPGTFGEIEDVQFIPEKNAVIDYAAPQVFHTEGDQITLNVKRATSAENPVEILKGILVVSEKGHLIKRAIQVESPVHAHQKTDALDSVESFATALGLAFLGGLILNIMPCVLPVIALKIFGFVKMAAEKRRVILQHGWVFSLGVLLSFWTLSALLLILRASGEGIGWGFQLQEPTFVVILASLLFMLGLSLFGLFELGTSLTSLAESASTSRRSSPLLSSFLSGVLATLVATPCTGPLLGPALGFAMTLSAFHALLIFTAMGLGMAAPYLLFSAFPHWVRYLPKPGNWMTIFKQLMGFLMMATVIWLIWVFGAQTNDIAMSKLLVALLIMAIGGWIFGRWATPLRKRMTRMIATLLAALTVLTGGLGAISIAKSPHDSDFQENMLTRSWEPYSSERLTALRAAGTPVFIDFTAKWCLICQANKVILHSADVEKAFHEKGVVTMVADWTKRDAEITEQLNKLGRTGVPVYVLYSADQQEKPYILPQTLTSAVVQSYLEKLL